MRKHSLLFLLLLTFQLGFTQVYNFKRYTPESGLPQASVNCIFEDSRGYIWIGAPGGGLTRFDGKKFLVYEDEAITENNFVNDLCEDSIGNLVIATEYNGISIHYGNYSESFNMNNSQITTNQIFKVTSDKNNVYFVCKNGVFRKDNKNNLFQLCPNGGKFEAINSFLKDATGTLWLGSDQGVLLVMNKQLINLNKFMKQNCFFGKCVVTKDKAGNVFIGTPTGKIYRLSVTDINANNYSGALELEYARNITQEPIQSILVAKSGSVWIATSNKVYRINEEGHVTFNELNGLKASKITCMMQDKNNDLWIGSDVDGLFKTGPQTFISYENIPGLDDPLLFGIFTDGNTLYAGSRTNGIVVFDQEKHTSYTIPYPKGIACFVKSHSGEIIVGTYEGLAKIKNGKAIKIKIEGLIDEPRINVIKQLADGTFLIGTYGRGLLILDKDFKLINHFWEENSDLLNYVYTIDDIEFNKFLLGTNDGVYVLENGKLSLDERFDCCGGIISVSTKDMYGNYWFASNKCVIGLINKNKIVKIGKANGMQSLLIYTLIADKKGSLWVGTNKGIERITLNSSGEIEEIHAYSFNEGFSGYETNMRAQYLDEEGNLYLGTIKGLYKGLINYTLSKSKLPDVAITDVKLFYKNLRWDTISNTKRWFNIPDPNYEFDTEDNNLTFEFQSVNPNRNEKVFYSFILEGFDKNWSPLSENPFVVYSNLSPGKYKFKVRSTHNGYEFGKASELPFKIKVPFYQTRWFLVSLSISLLLLFYLFIRRFKKFNENYYLFNSNLDVNQKTARMIFLLATFLYPLSNLMIYLIDDNVPFFKYHTIASFGFLLLTFGFTTLYKYLNNHILLILKIAYTGILFHTMYINYISGIHTYYVIEHVIILFMSIVVFNGIRNILILSLLNLLYVLVIFFTTESSEFNLSIYLFVMLITSVLLVIIIYTRININESLMFSSGIINKGNSLALAADKNGKLIFISENVTEILGFKPSELLGYNWWKLTSTNSFDYEKIKEDTLATSSTKSVYKRKVKTKDGNFKWIQWMDKKLSDDLIIGVGQDVTSQVELEEEYEYLVENADDAIYRANNEGKFTLVNKKTLDITKYNEVEMLGMHFYQIIDREYKQEVFQYYKNQLENNIPSSYCEFPIIDKYGERVWIGQKAKLDFDQTRENTISGFVCVARDISEKKKYELEIEKNREELNQYAFELEIHNTLKEKLIYSYNLEDISFEVLGTIKKHFQNCLRVSLLKTTHQNEIISEYYIDDFGINKIRHHYSDLKSIAYVMDGSVFIERNLTESVISSSDNALLAMGVVSYIVVPVMKQREFIASLNISFSTSFALNDNELKLLKDFSTILSVAIQQLDLKLDLIEKDKDITDSLNYARRIQMSMLPDFSELKDRIKNVSLVYLPRDIVSGDFYWFDHNKEYTFIVVADCTGHGVPAAFLTLLGSNLLQKIIIEENEMNPTKILRNLDRQFQDLISRNTDGALNDGMEMGICVINHKHHYLKYAGAGTSLMMFKKDKSSIYKGNIRTIGDKFLGNIEFIEEEISLEGDERFYMFSDGFHDQIGGDGNKRYSKKAFQELLNEIHQLSAEEQGKRIVEVLKNFKGLNPQTDDILILGFEVIFPG